MRNKFYKGRFVFITLGIAAFLSLISFVVMQLWNHLLPEILHVGPITFWQAMGIFILSKLLFGFHHRGGRMGPPWMRHKCRDMSDEQRNKFREEMRSRMCNWRNMNSDERSSLKQEFRDKMTSWKEGKTDTPSNAPEEPQTNS